MIVLSCLFLYHSPFRYLGYIIVPFGLRSGFQINDGSAVVHWGVDIWLIHLAGSGSSFLKSMRMEDFDVRMALSVMYEVKSRSQSPSLNRR